MSNGSVRLGRWMNIPSIVQVNNNYDEVILGLINEPMQTVDHFFSTEVFVYFLI